MKLLKQLMEMSPADLNDVNNMLDYMFKEYGVRVVRTGRIHFPERSMGERDEPTKQEVIAAFAKMKQKYGPLIKEYRDNNRELLGILQDMSSELNIVFSIHFNRPLAPNKYPFYGITIKRKNPAEFFVTKAGGERLRVESVKNK